MSETTTTTTSVTRTVDGLELPTAGSYALDPSTDVGFVVRHLMVSKVRGSFTDVAELGDDHRRPR